MFTIYIYIHIHSAYTGRFIYYEEMAFWKEVFLPQTNNKGTKGGWGFMFEVNGQTIASEKNLMSQIFPEEIEIFLQKCVGHNYRASKAK